MFFRMVYDESLAQAAYLIGCQKTGEAIVFDPERDVDRYEKLAAANGLRIVAAAETHIHADFLSGSREYAARGAKAYLSDEGDADWKYQWPTQKPGGGAYDHRLLGHRDVFRVGHIEFTALHTPGHTPEHLCFMVTDRGGGADKPLGVITGDFLFVGDVGRPDLLESAAGHAGNAASSAQRLYQSIREFTTWPDYLQVWPGHGAGSACGKALGSVPQSSVGYERLFNASILAATSEAAFVSYILQGQPEPPLYFARMKRENKAGPRVLGGVPKPEHLSVGAIAAIDGRTNAIVDTRAWPDFRAGHLKGSLSLPLSKAFPTEAGSMIAEGEPIYLVVDPTHLDEAVRLLIRVGLDSIAGWIEPCAVSGASGLVTTAEIGVREAQSMIAARRPYLLDARRAAEFAEGHIPGATNFSHTRLLAHLNAIPKDRPVLVNCRSGVRSARACSLLQRHGHDVTNLAGGFLAWEEAGAYVER